MSQNVTPKRECRRTAFLAAYGISGCIQYAAQAAGVSRRQHYRWLADPGYRARFEDAREEAVDRLEAEARRRAAAGVPRLRFHRGQPVIDPATGEPYVEREYSDTLLIFLLKAARPEVYRERPVAKAPTPVSNSADDACPLHRQQAAREVTLQLLNEPEYLEYRRRLRVEADAEGLRYLPHS